MSHRCNVFVKNIQSDDFEVRAAEITSFTDYLSSLLESGLAPVHVLGQGVCSNILYLLITKHVQPVLLSKGTLLKGRGASGEKMNEIIALPLLAIMERIHASIPHDYPLVPLLWKSSGALRKVLEHIFVVLESETLLPRCGTAYTHILRLILRFGAYHDVLTVLEVNRASRRLLTILVKCREEMEAASLAASATTNSNGVMAARHQQGSSLALGTAAADALSALFASPTTVHVLESKERVAQRVCELVNKYHSGEACIGVPTQPLHTDFKLQAHLVKAMRRLVCGTQYDDVSACKGNGLIKPLLTLWHRTTRRGEWRAEVIQFVSTQLSFMFSTVIADGKRLYSISPTASISGVDAQSLFFLHIDIVPLVHGILFPQRREQEYDGAGKLRLFPFSPSMQHFVDLGSLVCFLSALTFREFVSKYGDHGGDVQQSTSAVPPLLSAIQSHIAQLVTDVRSGARLGEMGEAVLASLHFLNNPITTMGVDDTQVIVSFAESLLSCFPSSSPVLNAGIMGALTCLWPRLPQRLLERGWSVTAPSAFPSRNTWSPHMLPSPEICTSLLCLLHSLRSKGVFSVPFVEGFDFGRCALLLGGRVDWEGKQEDETTAEYFQPYLADFFVEASSFTVNDKDATKNSSHVVCALWSPSLAPLVSPEDVGSYLMQGFSGGRGARMILNGSRDGRFAKANQNQSLYQVSADYVESNSGGAVNALRNTSKADPHRWANGSAGDVLKRSFSLPSLLGDVLPDATHTANVKRFCAFEACRLQLRTLGNGSTGEKKRRAFEECLQNESVALLNPWHSAKNFRLSALSSARSHSSQHQSICYSYPIPVEVVESIAVYNIFERSDGSFQGSIPLPSLHALSSASAVISSSLTFHMSKWANTIFDSIAKSVEKQEGFESDLGSSAEGTQLVANPSRFSSLMRIVSMNTLSAVLTLRTLLYWRQCGAWQVSCDEDDARVLLERSFIGHEERHACCQRLTPQGGIGLVVMLLLRTIESQLKRIDIRYFFAVSDPHFMRELLEMLNSILGALELLSTDVGSDLCSAEVLSWDPQRLSHSAFTGICAWLSNAYQDLLEAASLEGISSLMLTPSQHQRGGVGGGAVHNAGGSVGDGGLIGFATAAFTEVERSIHCPLLDVVIQCIGRSARIIRHLHITVLSRIGAEAEGGSSDVTGQCTFSAPIFDEHQLLCVTFQSFFRGGLLPNEVIVNLNPMTNLANPFRGVQNPPIALLESADMVIPLLCCFRGKAPGAVSGGNDDDPHVNAVGNRATTVSSADRSYSILHDLFYIIRCLYSESHLGIAVRLTEAISRDECAIPQSEWGAGVLKDLLSPKDATTRSVRFLSAVAFNGERYVRRYASPASSVPGQLHYSVSGFDSSSVMIDVTPSLLSIDMAIPPIRTDFILTDTHRIEICRSQANAIHRCLGKRWGVAVGRSLFASCNGSESFIVRLHAASYISLPFKIYQRNLTAVLGELLEQVRGVEGFRERSRCATSLLAVANSCAFAPSIEGDVVSFMLEMYATRSFEFKRMLLDALEYTLGHRHEVTKASKALTSSSSSNSGKGAGGEAAGQADNSGVPLPPPAQAAPPQPLAESEAFTLITRTHINRILFDWLWIHGYPLASFPSQCFGFATVDPFITDSLPNLLPLAVLVLHKTVCSGSNVGGASSAYLHPPQGAGGEGEQQVVDKHDSSPMDKINDVMRSSIDMNSLLRQYFSEIVSFLFLLSRCDDTAGTKAPMGTSLRDYRLSAEKALGWLRVQVGVDLFTELCRRNTERIVIEALARCRDTSPILPFVSFKVLCNGLSCLCELTGFPNFPSLLSAHHGDRAYMILTAVYAKLKGDGKSHSQSLLSGISSSKADLSYRRDLGGDGRGGEAVETMRVLQGLMTGLFGQPCLRIPMVLEASLRILCYIIHEDDGGSGGLRSIACETFKSVWGVVAELKDGVHLLQPHFQLVSSFLSTSARDNKDVSDCFTLVSKTFGRKSHANGLSAADDAAVGNRRTESTSLSRQRRADDEENHNSTNTSNPLMLMHFVEPSQALLGAAECVDTSRSRDVIGQKRARAAGSAEASSFPTSAGLGSSLSAAIPSAGQVLQAIRTLPATLSRLGASIPPPSFFLSMSRAADSQGIMLRNAVTAEVTAREFAQRQVGASAAFIRSEQLAVTERFCREAGDVGTGEGDVLSAGPSVTITESIQRAARHVFLVTVRTDAPLTVRTAAMDALRSLVGCLTEGCAMEDLQAIDFAPSPIAALEVMESTNSAASARKGQSCNVEGRWNGVNFSTHTLEDNVINLYCRLLSQVRALTVDSDPTTMLISSAVLRDVCAEVVVTDSILSSSMAVLRDHYGEEYAKIKPFRREQAGPVARGLRPSKGSSTGTLGWDSLSATPEVTALIASFPSIPSQELWQLAKTEPECFLRAFTTQLLRSHVVPQFPYLAPFAALTAIHIGFAEMYLPLVLLHVSMRKPTDEKERLRKFLATNIDALLRNKDVSVHLMRVMLNAVNFIRGARTSIIKHFGLHDPTYAQQTASTEEEKRRERATKEVRQEFDRLNRTSVIGYRDKISRVLDVLWFPTEHLPLTTLVAACAFADEWGLCVLLTELMFDGIEDTAGLTAAVTYSIGFDSVLGRDGGGGAMMMGGSVSGGSTVHITRKAAKAQRLNLLVKSLRESVAPALLQCAIRVKDCGLLRQLLFAHRSLLAGLTSEGGSQAPSSTMREFALALSRQRQLLLGNVSSAMQLDERYGGGFGNSSAKSPSVIMDVVVGSKRGAANAVMENAVRAPGGSGAVASVAISATAEALRAPTGTVAAEILMRIGCPSVSHSISVNEGLAEAAAEAAWRCGNWDLSASEVNAPSPSAGKNTSHSSNVHRCIHAALCHTFANDAALTNTAVVEGREAIVGKLNAFNIIESCAEAQSLREIMMYGRISKDAKGMITSPPNWLILKDNKLDAISGRQAAHAALKASRQMASEFAVGAPHSRVVEPLFAVRNALSTMGMPQEWRAEFLAGVAREAAEGGFPHTVHQWVNRFVQEARSHVLLSEPSFAIARALLLNATGDEESSMQVLADMPSLSKSNEALALLGAWTARNQRVPLHKLVRDPFMRQMTMEGELFSEPNMYVFASWCDALTKGVKESLESKNVVSTFAHLRSLETHAPDNAKDAKAFDLIRREYAAAGASLQSLQNDLNVYCDTTLIGFASCLSVNGNASSGNDLHAVYRILHYWLGESPSPFFSQGAQERIMMIAPVKFLPVFPQLVVRVISTAEQQRRAKQEAASKIESYDLLRRVVLACIEAFPTHCLWYVFSLRYSTDTAKSEAAAEMIEHIASIKALQPLVIQMATMVDAYLQQGTAAKERDGSTDGATLPVLIEAASKCPAVPVPTVPSPLTCMSGLTTGAAPPSVTALLSSHPNGFFSVGTSYRILGGISKPRLITITMVNGFVVKQIVKGNDDLRQDAVIEQVFNLSNTLLSMRSGGTGVVAAAGLRGDPLAALPLRNGGGGDRLAVSKSLSEWDSHERLYMRTYAVVPLGPGCGLIQFLDTAMPFAEYLADDISGAHRRYFPKDFSNTECRAMMSRHRGQQLTINGKSFIAAFEEVCEGFSPAMHYFFNEHFTNPKQWVECRKKYTTTAAVSSIIGYIVGLGDRHASNVMIDRQSAEIIHIDLGISFDQGQLLPIPETVPFRLTRDVVDGMGIFGIEGPYRAICEQTLSTMRQNKQLLASVVETFVYDPLARWSIAIDDNNAALPAAADGGAFSSQMTRQKATRSTPLKAHSVLRKTEDKLTGLEAGEVLGVANQVQMLLQRATDPENLCSMFQGWSAWL